MAQTVLDRVTVLTIDVGDELMVGGAWFRYETTVAEAGRVVPVAIRRTLDEELAWAIHAVMVGRYDTGPELDDGSIVEVTGRSD